MWPLSRLGGARLAGTCALFAAASWPCLSAAAAAPADLPDSELLLVDCLLDQHVLSHDLATYHHGDGVYVPLGELSRLLGIAVDVDPETGLAQGFVLNEGRAFRLNARTGEAIVDGKPSPCDRAGIVVKEDDIYVEAALVDRWFPLRLDFDPNAAQVKVSAREPLPLQQFFERQARDKKGGEAAAVELPRVELPYRLFDWPAIDQNLVATMRQDSAGQPMPSARYSTFATGELLFMSGDLYMTGSTQDPVSTLRASLGRKDPDAGLLGPLKATEAAIGQLALPGLSLVANPQPGLGVTLSNFPLNQASQFDHHTFTGNLPAGWDIELYRGEQLLGHQTAGADGRYLFQDVPLLMGLNDFRLVFYGPQGQRREEHYPFNVGTSLTPPGSRRYRATVSMQPDGTPASTLQYDMGLLPQLSTTIGLATLSADGVRTEAATIGARGFWGSYFLTGDLGVSPDGLLSQVGAQTAFGPLNVALKHARSGGFTSQAFAGGTSVRSHSEGRLDWPGLGVWDTSVSSGVMLSLDELRQGGAVTQASWPVTVAYHDLYVSHRLNVTVGEGAPPGPFNDATVQVSGRWNAWGLRGDLGYSPQGLRGLSFVAAAKRWLWDYNVNLGVSRTLSTGETSFLVNLSRDLGVCFLGMDANPQSINMNLTSTLSLDPALGTPVPRSMPQAGAGNVLARVFLDLNRDGHWDPGEPPVEGAGVSPDGAQPTLTNAMGLAVLRTLTSYAPVELSLAADTLSDTLWVPARPGVRVVPRPGRTLTVDFPILPTGEVDGTVSLKRQGHLTELGGAQLELADATGRVVASTRSAYDGFYTFTQVPPGAYQLRIPDGQFTKRPLAHTYTRDVVIGPNGTLLEGLDFTLELRHDATPNPPKPSAKKPAAEKKPAARLAGPPRPAGRPSGPRR